MFAPLEVIGGVFDRYSPPHVLIDSEGVPSDSRVGGPARYGPQETWS